MTLAYSIRLAFPVFLSCSLVACGGGSGFSAVETAATTTSQNPDTSTTTTDITDTTETAIETAAKVNTLRLSTSSFQLESDGKIPVTISALAKNASNVLLENPDISIAVDSGADVTIFNGTAIKTATLTPGLYDNRLLTVTAKSGDITETIQVEVLGTQLTLDGPQRMSLNTPTEYKILVRDSGNNPIGNQNVLPPTVSAPCVLTQSAGGNELNSAGEYIFQISSAQGGVCQLNASDFGASSTLDIEVSGDEFTIAPSSDKTNDVVNGDDAVLEVPVNTDETINLLLKQNSNPVSGAVVQLSSTRGTITSQVMTDTEGKASFAIQSANSGDTVITASTNGLTAVLKDLEFVATNPAYINTQASPSIVTPLGKSIVTTRIRDINDNPVKNKNITFNLSDTVGGSLNNSEAKTDSLGRASIEYTAGNTTSALDDVVITSTVQGTVAMTDTVKLTVGGNALRVVLGTDNKLSKAGVSYNQTFVVLVTDSAGNPIKDQNVNVSIVPTHYYKGHMAVIGDRWVSVTQSLPVTDPVTFNGRHQCETEDINNNGLLDAGEDTDTDSKLEPTHDASVAAVDASGKTGDDGSLLITVSYPQSRALWSRQELVVTTSSNGTDYEERTSFDLNILASDVSDITVEPPNTTSPYGVIADCSNSN